LHTASHLVTGHTCPLRRTLRLMPLAITAENNAVTTGTRLAPDG